MKAVVMTVVLYVFIVFFGIVLLAAVQLRSAGGATYDTWRLNYKANSLRNDELVRKVKDAAEKARNSSNGLSGSEICLRLFDESGLPKKELLDEQTLKQIEEAKQNRTNRDELTGDVRCVFSGYSWSQSDRNYFKGLAEEDAAEIADLKKSLTINTEQKEELIKGRQDFLAFHEMENIWYLKPFVVTSYDLLVLLLVMLMGALGGIVRLLRDYGVPDQPNPTSAQYVLIPLIGTVVAIAGDVLAKSGLLLLSSGGADSSLSPFMISLVGIVSGLLAKEVIETISTRGRNMLSGNGT